MQHFEIKVDYISATFPLFVQANDVEDEVKDQVVIQMSKYLNIKDYEVLREDYTNNRYRYQYLLGQHMILRLSGSENESGYRTCQLEMKGEGCRDFERRNPEKTWMDFFIHISLLSGTFKRIDIAIDDFVGDTVDMNYILKKVKNRFYTSVCRTAPTQIGNEENGISLNFGSRKSGQELCIYDKRKQLLSKRQFFEGDYWMRYEMRFRGENAQALTTHIVVTLKNQEKMKSLATIAFEQLYRILDIKKDNNYSEKYQSKIETDDRWNEFLKNVKKGILPKPTEEISSLEKHSKFIEDKAVLYLILMYQIANKDIELFTTSVIRLMYKHSELSKKRFRRLNTYLAELKLNTFSDDDLEDLRIELFSIIKERELPF